MTKPWEEVWTRDIDNGGEPTMHRPLQPGEGIAVEIATFHIFHPSTPEQVQAQWDRRDLAAAAPAMARMLCRAEQAEVGKYGDDAAGCLECFAAWTWVADDMWTLTHKPDCLLDAILNAAGLDAADREAVRAAARR